MTAPDATLLADPNIPPAAKPLDLTKPLSRFDASYWAMKHGVAASIDAADWSVLCAIYLHLPDAQLGKGSLEILSGRAESTVKVSRKRLREFGLIDYPESTGGEKTGTLYIVSDIRRLDVVEGILQRIQGAANRPGRRSTGPTIAPVQSADARKPADPELIISRPRTAIEDFNSSDSEKRQIKMSTSHLLPHPITSEAIAGGAGGASGAARKVQTTQAGGGAAVAPASAFDTPSLPNAALPSSGPAASLPPATLRTLAIDPSSSDIGWAFFSVGPDGVTLISSYCHKVAGGEGPKNAPVRIIEAGKYVARIIIDLHPDAIILEEPFDDPASDRKRLWVFRAAVEEIKKAIRATGLPCYLVPAKWCRKEQNQKLFNHRIGRPAAEDEADAFSLLFHFLDSPEAIAAGFTLPAGPGGNARFHEDSALDGFDDAFPIDPDEADWYITANPCYGSEEEAMMADEHEFASISVSPHESPMAFV